jgi:Family of unknown function (DUF5989)
VEAAVVVAGIDLLAELRTAPAASALLMPSDDPDDFRRASERPRTGFLREPGHFLAHNKKWWLAPILAVLLVPGALIVLGGTAVVPFIHTLF